jgi:hypothetical protein
MINIEELRKSIQNERERLKKRPVPKQPWIIPLSPNGLEELLDLYERRMIEKQSFGQENPRK